MRLFVRLKPRRGGDRGFILIVVIWAIGLLALIATSFALSVRSHLREIVAVEDLARAQALADTGANLAILDIVNARTRVVGERRFPVDGSPKTCVAETGGRLTIVVEDEFGKIDVNTANPTLLKAFFKGLGLETSRIEALTDAIADFRDADQDRQPHGAEAAEYAAAGRTFGPKNMALDVAEELQQVLGLDADLFARMRPFVTVYSGQTGIDTVVAPRELLTILSNEFPPTEAIESTDFELAAARPRLQLPPGATTASTQSVFTVRAVAVTPAGTVFVREALVELGREGFGTGPYVLRRWRRGSLPAFAPQPEPADGGEPPAC